MLRTLANTGALGKVTFSPSNNCESCHLAKQTATPFTTSNHISSERFDLIQSDIWGPSPVTSISGYSYYVSFIDDCSRYTWVYLMRHRSEVLQIYTDFTNMVYTQFQKRVKAFRYDVGKEYLSLSMQNLLNPMVHSINNHILTHISKMSRPNENIAIS